ncbi:MAG: hypothetical protein IIC79_06030 [Chloroflexi bacterium]|nr:hypothetical protein [Chloroflexota bacterium]
MTDTILVGYGHMIRNKNSYFAGGMYEVTDPSGANTITRYYGIHGQSVAKYDGTDLEYILTDQQGSTMAGGDLFGRCVAHECSDNIASFLMFAPAPANSVLDPVGSVPRVRKFIEP